MSDLEALFPAPRTIEVVGVVLQVRELTIAQLPTFVRALAPVMSALTDESGIEIVTVMNHIKELTDAVEIATGAERAWIDGLPASALLKMIEGVLEANADFFGVALRSFMTNMATRSAIVTG
ncbi:MAG: hypothetical protein ACREXT_10965 [Gammaproteobacteria bacterium]